jgi:integrase
LRLDPKRADTSALRRAKIGGANFHSLRHTFASHLLIRNAILTQVSALLGHSSVTTTMLYAHHAAPHLRNTMDLLNGITKPEETAHELHIEGKIAASAS